MPTSWSVKPSMQIISVAEGRKETIFIGSSRGTMIDFNTSRIRSGMSVGVFAVIQGGHENDFFRFIDLVKEPPGADAVTPRFRLPISQFFDVEAEMRL